MDATFQELSGCLREVELRMTTEELQPKLDEAIKKFQPTVAIKGFRKGHVPLRMVRKMFGEAIEHDTLQNLAETEFKRLVEEQHLEPVGQPALIAAEHPAGELAVMRIRYEVKPEFTLADISGLAVQQSAHELSDAEVDAEIDRQRYIESTSDPAEEITSDDFIATVETLEVDEATHTTVIGGMHREDRIYLRRPAVPEPLRSALHNKRVGDSFFLTEPARDDAPGRTLQYTVGAIEHVELPPLTDEFAARLSDGKAATVAEYRDLVRTEMARQYDEHRRRSMRDQLANAYVAKHDFPIPEALTHELLRSMLDEYTKNGRPRNFSEEDFHRQMHPSAEWQARWLLIREALIAQHGLEVTDADLDAFVEADHAKLGIDKDRLLQFYKTSQQAKDRILLDKVFALLETGVS